jgi:hypothetical protein
MSRDYTDCMNMTPGELARYARTRIATDASLTTGYALILAMSYHLEREEYTALRLAKDLIDAERRADSWREEAQAVQRQLDMVRG